MGWFLITIVLPLLAPILLIAPYKLLPRSAGVRQKARFIVAVKDGQLCWGAIAFCAAGIFELYERTDSPVGGAARGWATGGLIALLVASSFIAAAGAVFATEEPRPPEDGWCSHYRNFVASVVVTVLASFLFTLVHFKVW